LDGSVAKISDLFCKDLNKSLSNLLTRIKDMENPSKRSVDSVVEVFSTCPMSSASKPAEYLAAVANVARWSEENGCKGILVYTDNSLVDPWLVSQVIIQNTHSLCPLVAVQPVYMHPYTVAKMVASFSFLYGRKVYLNMVAGGFKNDLIELNDTTPHDKRYQRIIEYTSIIQQLLTKSASVSFSGEFYRTDKLKMTPNIPSNLFPEIFLSGSSEAGLAAARELGAIAVRYPKPAKEYETEPIEDGIPSGIRVGIVARESGEEAWRIARSRFPEDRKGQLTHQLALKVSDSEWHKQLSRLSEQTQEEESPYWLVPFQNYKTFCPYLVGSYQQVGNELARYMAAGYDRFILDIPPNEEELHHIGVTFQHATHDVPA
jgi:alkanesulfonate monooxygenase